MLWLGPGWQGVAWGYPPDEGALAGLAHAKVACIQHSKPHLRNTFQHGSVQHTASRHWCDRVTLCLGVVSFMAQCTSDLVCRKCSSTQMLHLLWCTTQVRFGHAADEHCPGLALTPAAVQSLTLHGTIYDSTSVPSALQQDHAWMIGRHSWWWDWHAVSVVGERGLLPGSPCPAKTAQSA